MTTTIQSGLRVPTLDTPTPQPLPGHGDDSTAPTTPATPAAPTPPRTQFALGTTAALLAVPAAIVATEKFGANRWAATGIAGAALGLGMLGTFNYMQGPDAPPSPGRVSFDEIARPAAPATFGVTTGVAGASLLVGGFAAFCYIDSYGMPKWPGNLALVGAVAGATFGLGVGAEAIGHWAHDATQDARDH